MRNSLALELYNQIQLTKSLPRAGGLFSQPIQLMDRIMIIERVIREEQERKEREIERAQASASKTPLRRFS